MTSFLIWFVMVVTFASLMVTDSYNDVFGFFATAAAMVMLITFSALTLFANPKGSTVRLIVNVVISAAFPFVLILLIQPVVAVGAVITFALIIVVSTLLNSDYDEDYPDHDGGLSPEEEEAERMRAYDDPNSPFHIPR